MLSTRLHVVDGGSLCSRGGEFAKSFLYGTHRQAQRRHRNDCHVVSKIGELLSRQQRRFAKLRHVCQQRYFDCRAERSKLGLEALLIVDTEQEGSLRAGGPMPGLGHGRPTFG